MDQRNYKKNFQNIFWIEVKQKTAYQSVQNAVKAVPRGKFTALNTYQERRKVSFNSLGFHLRKLGGKKQHTKPKARRRKKKRNIRVEINETGKKKKSMK